MRDYKKVAPRYGTNDDLAALFAAAHERGMHVILDLVPGHTSEEHEWFRHSAEVDRNEYSDRYIWTDSWISAGDGLPFIGGETPRNGTYILNFFKCQPALNYGFAHPQRAWQKPAFGPEAIATCDAMVDVMRFWLSLGADGFRVDMADSLVKQDDAGKPFTIRTWQYMFSKIRPEFPEAAFVSEWGRPNESLEAGFDMDFYLDWRWDGIPNGYNMLLRNVDNPLSRDGDKSYFNVDSGTPISDFLEQYEPQLREAEHLGGTFNFITCNHDTARVAPRLSEREIALAYCTLFAMPGVPFIYYGDEIGMRYRDLPTKEGGYVRTGSRTPMQWQSIASLNASYATPAITGGNYLPVDPSPDAPNVADSQSNKASLWYTVRRMLHLRGELRTPSIGSILPSDLTQKAVRIRAFDRSGTSDRGGQSEHKQRTFAITAWSLSKDFRNRRDQGRFQHFDPRYAKLCNSEGDRMTHSEQCRRQLQRNMPSLPWRQRHRTSETAVATTVGQQSYPLSNTLQTIGKQKKHFHYLTSIK